MSSKVIQIPATKHFGCHCEREKFNLITHGQDIVAFQLLFILYIRTK